MSKFFYIIFPIYFLIHTISFSQNLKNEAVEKFYFDAVVFEGDTLNSGRLDVLVLVPYQTLNFIKSGSIFGASYEIEITISDTLGNKIESSRTDKTIREEEYFVTRGGTGQFDFSQTIFYLKPGKYRITTNISDKFSKQSWDKNRIITVLDFGEYDFSLSGILLLNSVEEVNGKFKITPHISDNIGNLSSGFFIFFEANKTRHTGDSVDYVWEIYNSKNELIAFSNRARKSIPKIKNQTFIKVPKVDELVNGAYIFKLIALEPDTVSDVSKSKILAITQRTINYIRTFGGNVLEDIGVATKQLRYIAYQTEIDYINEGSTIAEKQKRFEAYWKKIDPSPGTDRNEAFEEYYSRIDYANKSFKSFQDGWMTDKGMVYIIFGPPYNSERQNNYNDARIYEKWTYMNNREFIFADNSGFGDFRLVRPMSITEKYKYLR
jgi:GWxTD domain-containing protein